MSRFFACILLLTITVPSPAQDQPKAPLSVFEYDQSKSFDIIINGQTEKDGHEVIDFTYASPAGGRVPALMFLPKGEGPFPGLIILHGLPGNRHNTPWLAEKYVPMGALVVSITAPFARPESNPRQRPITLTEADRSEQIQLMQDLQRAVDILIADERVDAKNMGFNGGSYGAAMGGLFAGIERRIKAYALWVGDGGLVTHVRNGRRFRELPETSKEKWLDAMWPIEPIRFIGDASPAALYLQAGRNDRAVRPADARAFMEAASEPKKVTWYETGHGLNDQAFEDQGRWMAEQLGLDFTKWGR